MPGTPQRCQILCLLGVRGNLYLICSPSSVGVKLPVKEAPFMCVDGLLLFYCIRMAVFCPGVWAGMNGANGFHLHVELVRRFLAQRYNLSCRHHSKGSLRNGVAWDQAMAWPRVISQCPPHLPVLSGWDCSLPHFRVTPQLASILG